MAYVHAREATVSGLRLVQVEGLRNEYNRVTSGDQPKAGAASASDDTAQLKQQAQSLQAS